MASKGVLAVRVIGNTKDFEKSIGSVGKNLAKFGAAAAGIGAAVGAGLFKMGESFDAASDTIRIGTGATGAALKALEHDFDQVVSNVPASFEDASTAVADLNTRLGLTGQPLQAMSEQFLNLARITGEEVAPLIAAGTRLFGDFSVAAEDQAKALDYVFKASQATGIGVTDLSDKMVQFGAPLRQLGFGFEESAALLAKWEKEGVNTEAVLAGMKAGLGKMAKAGEEPIDALQRLIKEMKEAGTQGEANAIAVEAFGTRAGPDMAAAVREGRFELEDLMGALEGSSETINKAAGDTEDFGEKWTKIKNRVLVKLKPLAMAVFDVMGRAMDKLGPVIDEVAGGFRAFFAAFKAGDGDVTSSGFPGFMEKMANSARDVFEAGKELWAGFQKNLLPTLKDIGAFIIRDLVPTIAKWYGFLATKVVPVVLDLAGKVARNLTPVIQTLVDVFRTRVLPVVQMVIDKFQEWWPVISKVIGFVAELASFLLGKLLPPILQVAGFIAGKLVGALVTVIDWIVKVIGWFTNWTGSFTELKENFGAGLKVIGDAFSGTFDAVKRVGETLWNGLQRIFATGANVVVGIFEGMVNSVIGSINAAIRAINIINPAKDIPFLDPVSFGRVAVPKLAGAGGGGGGIVRMAEGGIVKARPGGILANIGEGGQDEAVVPLGRGMGLGGQIVINVQGSVLSERDLVKVVQDGIRTYQRRNGGSGF